MDNEIKYLYLDDIIPNRFQPRENFDEQALKELAVSIREHGVIQPIVVRQIGEKYEIIAGERRYKASTLAGLTKIPAIIKNLDDKESSKVALIENLQRKDLTPIEEARTYQKILELDALTQEDLARTMGKSQSAVSNKMRLLTLTDEVQNALLHEQISERHARSLLNVEDPLKQVELLNKVINTRMTVRELDNEIKNMNTPVQGEIKENNVNLNLNNNPNEFGSENKIEETNINVPPINTIPEINENPSNNGEVLSEEELIGDSNLFENNNTSPETIIKEQPEIIKMDNTIPNYNAMNNNIPNISDLNLNNAIKGINLDDINKQIEENEKNEHEVTINNINESNIINNNTGVDNIVNEIKSTVDKIKSTGKNVDVEEMNFDDFYQIVIRINK